MGAVYYVLTVARLTQFYISWAFCSDAVKYFHAVCRLPVLRKPPYDQHIFPSHVFNFVLVFWITFYLLFMTVVFFRIILATNGGGSTIVLKFSAGLVDFTYATLMLVAARLQDAYLPEHTGNGNCNEAYTWGVSKNESSLFTLISGVVDHGNVTVSGAVGQCQNYKGQWWIEKIMGNLALSTGCVALAYPAFRFLQLLTLCLVRIFRARWNSWFKRREQQSAIPMTQMRLPVAKFHPGETPFPTLFEMPEIVDLIARHSHYTDMKSFLSTCQASRAALNPDSLRKYCCINKGRTECWGCAVRVCQDCATKRSLAPVTTTVHLQRCQPCCFRCYWKGQYKLEIAKGKDNYKYCSCTIKQPAKRDEFLCRHCKDLSDAEVGIIRENRENTKMNRSFRWPLQCFKCHVNIGGRNLCWWGCRVCHSACDWGGHPSGS